MSNSAFYTIGSHRLLFLHNKFFKKYQKFQFYHTISLVSLAGHSGIMYIVGPPNRLVLSDLVKSWRGECGGIGIGPYCMYSLPYVYTCVCARRPRQGHCKCT